MADEVVLLDFWASPYGMRAKIALAQKGVKYENKEEDLSNKSSLLLQLNPVHKKIPVLIHNGKSVFESLIVVQYIDEVWNHKSPLLPSDPFQKAQARFWADYVDQKFFDHAKKLLMTKGEDQEAAKKEFVDCLKLLEDELGDKSYFGGDNLGFVDVALVPIYCYFKSFETLGNLNIEAECPKFIAWAKKCLQKESVSKFLPDQNRVYDYICEIRKKLGLE